MGVQASLERVRARWAHLAMGDQRATTLGGDYLSIRVAAAVDQNPPEHVRDHGPSCREWVRHTLCAGVVLCTWARRVEFSGHCFGIRVPVFSRVQNLPEGQHRVGAGCFGAPKLGMVSRVPECASCVATALEKPVDQSQFVTSHSQSSDAAPLFKLWYGVHAMSGVGTRFEEVNDLRENVLRKASHSGFLMGRRSRRASC